MDGEGVHSQRTVVVEEGILNLYAFRGLCIESNTIATKDELLRDVRDGIFVNEVILTRHLQHQVIVAQYSEKRRIQALERRYDSRKFRFKTGGRWHR